ncbi:MAG: S8 family peptidase [Crocinitomicaceae bacterium]|nr:S8 family peptidase [Crocinitomicaceae bacterium]
MKKLIVRLSFSFFALGISNAVIGQVDKDVLNWYNGKSGMNTTKAYKALKKKTSTTVIVAIIDSGIDIEHADLKGKIWTNTKEIAGNGIDDDNNGYIDDIHGWNFLGSPDGKNQQYTRLEKARMYDKLKGKFENVDPQNVAAVDAKEYEIFKKVSEEIQTDKARYTQISARMEQLPMILQMVPGMVSKELGKTDYTQKDLEKWKPETEQLKQIRSMALAMASGELSEEVIKGQADQINAMLDYYLNTEYNDREFIGDNPDDFTDVRYGNNDVEGPDALHGTHVGGIVGSIRGNNLGGDGVADNVLLMSLRAVPDGDEADKDIALAIRYAVDNGAQVINMSFGKGYSPHQKEVFEALKYADSKGVLMVHAAGNSNMDTDVEPNYPTPMYSFQKEKLDLYLTIGASTRFPKQKLAAEFSNFGQTSVDVFAPGHDIYNAVPQSDYKKLNGTSMASPMVAGVAALLKSYFPAMTMNEIKDVMLKSAKSYKGVKQYKPGTEELVDFGTLSVTGAVIDVNAAVKMCLALEKSKK